MSKRKQGFVLRSVDRFYLLWIHVENHKFSRRMIKNLLLAQPKAEKGYSLKIQPCPQKNFTSVCAIIVIYIILKVWSEMEILRVAFLLKLSCTKRRTASKPALPRGNGGMECVCVNIRMCTQTFSVAYLSDAQLSYISSWRVSYVIWNREDADRWINCL